MSTEKLNEDERRRRLGVLGVEETTDLEALNSFLEGYDFMKLGQAVNRGQWSSAMMILQRMDAAVQRLGIQCMVQPLKGVRSSVLGRNSQQAKQALALLVARRVSLLKSIKE